MQVTCPCGKSLRVDDSLAGKRIRCSGCQGVLTLPPLADVIPPRAQIKSAPRAAPLPPERPRQEDEEPRPRRDRRYEDEEDDWEERKPRRKKKRKKQAGPSAAAWIIIGVGTLGGVLLLAGLVAFVIVTGTRGRDRREGPGKAPIVIVQPDVANLREFSSVEGRFKVLLPGVPDEKPGPRGGKLFAVKGEECEFAIGVEDFPIPPNEPPAVIEKRLDGARDGVLKEAKGNLLHEKPVRLQGKYPGREILVGLPAPQGILRGRFYLVGNRAYLLMVHGEGAKAHSEAANRFLDSFTLTN